MASMQRALTLKMSVSSETLSGEFSQERSTLASVTSCTGGCTARAIVPAAHMNPSLTTCHLCQSGTLAQHQQSRAKFEGAYSKMPNDMEKILTAEPQKCLIY